MRVTPIFQSLKRAYIGVSIAFTTTCLLGFVSGLSLLLFAPEILPAKLAPKIDLLQYAAKDWKRQIFGVPGQRPSHFTPIEQWQGQGAHLDDAPNSPGRMVPVSSPQEFQLAIKNAMAGDIIRLSPGTYRLRGHNLDVSNAGLPGKPITIEARRLGEVSIELDMLEGFLVSAPYWVFQNLDIRGACKDDNACEHAFHIVGNGHHTVIRNNRIHEFNSPIKANGIPANGKRVFPDGGIIAHNSFYATHERNTDNPVSFLDMVGVSKWTVQSNLIADFAKAQGDKTSYGAFFKGGGEKNILEKNLIICAMHIPQTRDGSRVGLSFGGGGTALEACRTSSNACSPEQSGGLMRHNIILHCSDVGIYLNRAANSAIYNNTLFDTLGIDVRFPESVAMLANNLLDSRIANRNGGTIQQISNAVVSTSRFETWFTDASSANFSIRKNADPLPAGNPLSDGQTDFCGSPMPKQVVAGAIQPTRPCRPDQLFSNVTQQNRAGLAQ